MTGCRTRSPATTAGLAPAGLPWGFWCPLHACVRPVCERLTLLRGRSGIASSSLLASLHASAGWVDVDSQTAVARTTVLSADPADHYPLVAWMSGDKHADRSQLTRRPVSVCIAFLSWPRPQRCVAIMRPLPRTNGVNGHILKSFFPAFPSEWIHPSSAQPVVSSIWRSQLPVPLAFRIRYFHSRDHATHNPAVQCDLPRDFSSTVD